jgi:hypothetical protein
MGSSASRGWFAKIWVVLAVLGMGALARPATADGLADAHRTMAVAVDRTAALPTLAATERDDSVPTPPAAPSSLHLLALGLGVLAIVHKFRMIPR